MFVMVILILIGINYEFEKKSKTGTLNRKIRKKRKNPNFKPVPIQDQQFIIREMSQKGMMTVENYITYNKNLLKDITKYLCKRYQKGTFVLLSTRPRPSHIATWVINEFKVIRFEVKYENLH